MRIFRYLFIAGLFSAGTLMFGSKPKQMQHRGHISSVEVVDRQLIVKGSYLHRVKLWIGGPGAGVEDTFVGNAKRATPAGPSETWLFPIDPDDKQSIFAVVEYLFFEAINPKGKTLDVGYLKCGKKRCVGPQELHDRLFGRDE